jgi:F-type H+-transporting ATPase subunit b
LRRRFLTCLTLVLLVWAVAAFAQHEAAEHGESVGEASHELLWKAANFVILAGLLGYFLYKKAGAFFRSRTEAIRKGIEEADRLRVEAEARAAEIGRRMDNLQAEIEELRARAGAEMSAENERLRRDTQAALGKIREQAEQEIAGAAKAARHEVQEHAAQIAIELAAAKIKSLLSVGADQRLVSAFLDDLEKSSRKPPKELN